MKVKVIALRKVNKTPVGGELEVSASQARALVLVKAARYVDEADAAKPARTKAAPARGRRGASSKGGPVGAVTRRDSVTGGADAGTQQPIE